MDPQAFLRILEPYFSVMDGDSRIEIIQKIALAIEEYGEKTYDEIRTIMRRYNVPLPTEMCCKECKQDDDDTVLVCDWCGRYFHTKCSKFNTLHCSKQCHTIDYIKTRSSVESPPQ